MSMIYILESCGEPNNYTFRDGSTMSFQTIKLRELTGATYSKRWLVDNTSGIDLRGHVGKPIACEIENYVSEKDGREFNNLKVREVVKL